MAQHPARHGRAPLRARAHAPACLPLTCMSSSHLYVYMEHSCKPMGARWALGRQCDGCAAWPQAMTALPRLHGPPRGSDRVDEPSWALGWGGGRRGSASGKPQPPSPPHPVGFSVRKPMFRTERTRTDSVNAFRSPISLSGGAALNGTELKLRERPLSCLEVA